EQGQGQGQGPRRQQRRSGRRRLARRHEERPASAAPLHFFRLRAVAGFFFIGAFFSGEIRNAASGVSLTSGRSSERTFGVTFFATVHSMSGVSSGSSSSLPQGTSTFFFWATLSSVAAFRIAPMRSRSIFTSISSSRTCFFGYRLSA